MTQTAHLQTPPMSEIARPVVHRTRGRRHGPITRLMSPHDLGQTLKPFVFLDYFDSRARSFSGFGMHPHSGITTVTHLFEGSVRYEDTTGATGILPEGGVEWFKAAGGAWHGGGPAGSPRTRGFQLWLALPPDHELGTTESIYQAPGAIAHDGPARVLVGRSGSVVSRLIAPGNTTYLAVQLKAGESWHFEPAQDQTTAWIALSGGRVVAPEAVEQGEMAVFATGTEPIHLVAARDSEFVFGASAPHPHDLVLGQYSVHTSTAMLEAGEQSIAEIGRALRSSGLRRI